MASRRMHVVFGGGEMWEQWDSLVEIRISELRLYWTRFSALLAVNGGALALFRFWNASGGECGWESVLVAAFGTAFASLSVLILRGSHFWVRWWEDRLLDLEKKIISSHPGVTPVFSNHPHYTQDSTGKRHTSTFSNATRVMFIVLAAWISLLAYSIYSVI